MISPKRRTKESVSIIVSDMTNDPRGRRTCAPRKTFPKSNTYLLGEQVVPRREQFLTLLTVLTADVEEEGKDRGFHELVML
jgi:hypothetical protein